MKKVKIILEIFLCVVVAIAITGAFIVYDNMRVSESDFSVYSSKLPSVFDDYKIALITDFHNSVNYQKVLDKVTQMKPHIIVIAGDLINMDSTDYTYANKLLNGLVKIAPTYYTFGNHEVWSNHQSLIYNLAEANGVKVLNNEVYTLHYESDAINLIGFKDIGYDDFHMKQFELESELKKLYNKVPNKDLFNVLIFHRANYFDTIAKYPYDLVLAGHLHDGQVALPFIQKWILRNRVNSDQYTKGIYRKNNSQMIVSGGLEENFNYIRVNNVPEVVCVTLHTIQD